MHVRQKTHASGINALLIKIKNKLSDTHVHSQADGRIRCWHWAIVLSYLVVLAVVVPDFVPGGDEELARVEVSV